MSNIKRFFVFFVMFFAMFANASYIEDGSAAIASTLQPQSDSSFLKKFYTQLYNVPIWTQEGGLSNFARQLLKQIDDDKTLEANSKIRMGAFAIISKANNEYKSMNLAQKVAFEFEIANLYKDYTDHLLNGNINWNAFKGMLIDPKDENNINGGWVTYPSVFNEYNIMQDAIINGNLADTLNRAVPKGFNYAKMNSYLVKYIEAKQKGGWKVIGIPSSIKVGQSSKAIPFIKQRLSMTGELGSCPLNSSVVYDACLKNAIVQFQKNNNLSGSGVIDQQTAKLLSESVDSKIAKIRLNMDRIKWLNHRMVPTYIMVNIPDFRLTFIQNGKVLKEMRVIVGQKDHRTPIFSNRVTNIVLNPYWNVPTSIIKKEMIPKLLKNPNAMAAQGIEVSQGWGAKAVKINPATINWTPFKNSASVPFRFAQPPGVRNALGKVKFLFPNNFSVYMHDTPTKNLFNKDVRAFSHGCIRLSEPIELLKVFASLDGAVNMDSANKILKGNTETTLVLKNSVPVDIVYLTAWVDQNGQLQFRNDIYGYDAMQMKK